MPDSLDAIPSGRLYAAQQKALLKLHLWTIGETHRLLIEAGQAMRAGLLSAASADGTLGGAGLNKSIASSRSAWDGFMQQWRALVDEARQTAAILPFGTLGALHDRLMVPALKRLEREAGEARETTLDMVFNPQHAAVLSAANRRVYQDGLQISGRIWKLDTQGWAGIQRTTFTGVANGASAWDTAKMLEEYLGAGQDCPRWTSTRLYKLTKKQIAGGRRTGLYSGDECRGQGVAYKALRLARNEIQIIHHLATDATMQAMPFVEQEQVNLSPSHPVDDVCDQVVRDGEGGNGIYPVGTIGLPLHVQCLCYKTAVLMDPDQLVKRLRGWVDGSQDWPEMNAYSALLGGNLAAQMGQTRMVQDLTDWVFGDPYEFKQ